MQLAVGGTETTIQFFLQCANFNNQRQTLFDKITLTDATILTENKDIKVNTLLFGKPTTSENSVNRAILNSSIKFILLKERSNNSLF